MAATLEEPLLVSHGEGVAVLMLNRPAHLNALDDSLLVELGRALTDASENDAVRAVVITGAGRGFCSGADLSGGAAVGRGDLDVRRRLQRFYTPVITRIRHMDKPVVAAVNGVAAGAGMSLALACDLRVAGENSTFIQAFVRIGLVPDAGSTFFLPRLVGLGRATEIAMLGDRIEAAEALRVGLVNRVVADADVFHTARELAERLSHGPRSIGLIKRALNLSMVSDLHAQLQHEEDLQALAASSDDFAEGVGAFLEKRPATFTGR